MQIHYRQAERKQVTLRDLIATVNDLTRDEREAAEVINHMLRSEQITFTNKSAPRELRQLLQ